MFVICLIQPLFFPHRDGYCLSMEITPLQPKVL